VIEWLLLDRIDAESGSPTVARQKDPIADTLPDETESALPVVEATMSRTEVTLNPTI
jgi:hypothetical protein